MFLTLCPLLLFAQAPDTLWTNAFGEDTLACYGYSVQVAWDSGYVICGVAEDNMFWIPDIYIVKTDNSGNRIWAKTYGENMICEEAYDIQRSDDSCYVITGYVDVSGMQDVMILKIDQDGDTVWLQTYGGSNWDEGRSIQQTSDGGYIVTGYTHSFGAGEWDVWLLKTDSLGDTVWTKTYGDTRRDIGECVRQTSDNGYIITGTMETAAGLYRIYLIRTDSLGDTLWTRTYGSSDRDQGYSGIETSDHGFLVTGFNELNYRRDLYLIKTDSLGDTVWTKTYGGTDNEEGRSLQQTQDHDYIVCGYTYGQLYDVYLVRIDTLGDTLWTMNYGDWHNDMGWCVLQTSDNGYIIAGETQSFGSYRMYLLKTEPDIINIDENRTTDAVDRGITQTIFRGPLILPAGKIHKIFDITGRQIRTLNPGPGIYFIEVDDKIVQKVVKIR